MELIKILSERFERLQYFRNQYEEETVHFILAFHLLGNKYYS